MSQNQNVTVDKVLVEVSRKLAEITNLVHVLADGINQRDIALAEQAEKYKTLEGILAEVSAPSQID